MRIGRRVVLVLALASSALAYRQDTHNECADWARSGECRENPKFMLDGCQTSCGPVLKADLHAECPAWAASGECSANPGMMQLGCALSCGEAYLWSPFAKRALGLPAHAPPPEHRAHGVSLDEGSGNVALDALLELGSRLKWFFDEGEDCLPGLADGDNHYMLSVGIGELLLYVWGE